jgi:DNA-binding MarR family transcriptional regulator
MDDVNTRSHRTSDRSGVRQSKRGLTYLAPDRAAAFLGLLRAAEMLDRELDAELVRGHGISLRGFEVLLFLAVFAPAGHLRMADLTQRAPLSQSRMSRLVTELETAGLVTRSSADADRRGVTVSITPAGVERFRAAQETHLAGLDNRLFSKLTPFEIGRLAVITRKILATDDAAPGSSSPRRHPASEDQLGRR